MISDLFGGLAGSNAIHKNVREARERKFRHLSREIEEQLKGTKLIATQIFGV